MFKLLRDAWKLPRVTYALNAAKAAVDAGRLDYARSWMTKAYNMSLDTTFGRTDLINFILVWGLLSEEFRKCGDTAPADQCMKMHHLLQSRFDAGDYYREK
jgi:hypothetical protein